jgi:RNA polymerase sigma-70 factor (ECF subfamily)
MQTDAQLLAAARTDAHAFRDLYDRYAGRIHAFHAGRTRDHELALDLTAETFAQAWLSRRRFEDRAGGSAGPWLYAIARNVLVTSVRRHHLERSACERLGLLAEHNGHHSLPEPDGEWLTGLDDALRQLAPELEQAVRLRIVDELPYDEVARVASTSSGAARVRVHRALAALRARLFDPKEALR